MWGWIVLDVETQEIKSLRQVNDARLFLGEGQTVLFQPVGQDALHLFGVFPGFAKASGSRRTLLPPSPLRTVRAPLDAHGSSTSRTALLLFLFALCVSSGFAFCRQQVTVVKFLAIAQCSFRRGVNVLMAE